MILLGTLRYDIAHFLLVFKPDRKQTCLETKSNLKKSLCKRILEVNKLNRSLKTTILNTLALYGITKSIFHINSNDVVTSQSQVIYPVKKFQVPKTQNFGFRDLIILTPRRKISNFWTLKTTFTALAYFVLYINTCVKDIMSALNG